jgi:mono/diheme cytochrome c family protein
MVRFEKLAVFLMMSGLLLVSCGEGSSQSFSDPALSRGQRLFKRHCASCHSTKPGAVLTGPSMAGLATSAETRQDGMDSRTYIRRSITKPSEFVVEGFVDQMPATYDTSLSNDELDDLVSYLLTFE